MLQDFHFTHHIGIQERAKQKSDKTGNCNSFGIPQYQFKSLLIHKMAGGRCPYTDSENQNYKEIHQETCPDNEPHFPVAPDFGYQVIDNVGDGKNK